MKRLALATTMLVALATSASALQYTWEWTGTRSGHGTLETEGSHIISISGELGGLRIWGTLPEGSSPYFLSYHYINNLLPVDGQGIAFYTSVEPHTHTDNWLGTRYYYTTLAVSPYGFTLEARETGWTGHQYIDYGTFTYSPVPGPIVGAGSVLLLAGAALFTFRRKRN